jgi:hypothetical protein
LDSPDELDAAGAAAAGAAAGAGVEELDAPSEPAAFVSALGADSLLPALSALELFEA